MTQDEKWIKNIMKWHRLLKPTNGIRQSMIQKKGVNIIRG